MPGSVASLLFRYFLAVAVSIAVCLRRFGSEHPTLPVCLPAPAIGVDGMAVVDVVIKGRHIFGQSRRGGAEIDILAVSTRTFPPKCPFGRSVGRRHRMREDRHEIRHSHHRGGREQPAIPSDTQWLVGAAMPAYLTLE
jgi:hypothetical protein